MKNFKTLELELKKLNVDAETTREKLLAEAFQLMTKKIEAQKKKPTLADYIEKLEASKDLTADLDEWPCRWIRFDASEFIDTNSTLEREALEKYLDENFCIRIDYKNEALSMSDGPCIVINDDGDVYDQDSHKWIVHAIDYVEDGEVNIKKRNELIESYMEKTGHYPSVVRHDGHDNMFYVSTKEN